MRASVCVLVTVAAAAANNIGILSARIYDYATAIIMYSGVCVCSMEINTI